MSGRLRRAAFGGADPKCRIPSIQVFANRLLLWGTDLKFSKRQIVALCIGSIPLGLLAAWTCATRDVPETEGYQDGPRWYVLAGGTWHIEHTLSDSIRTKMPSFAHVKSSTLEEDDSAKHLSSYYIQLLATRVGGQRKVLVYGSCVDSAGDLTKFPNRAIGGGTCFFEAWFDPDANRFDAFQFNSSLG